MRVVEIAAFGAPDVLRLAERPVPELRGDEVLIRVAAAGLNRADLLQRRGLYLPPEGGSDILGLEVSGEIVATGRDAERWKSSDKVCALLAGGGYAEYVAVPEAQCLPVPAKLSLMEAAALPEAVFTVWANVFEAGALNPNESILIHGGAGGVGSMAIQMARAHGARVFATAGNAQKAALCTGCGAELAVHYREEDFVQAILRATNGKGVDVVLDIMGGDYVARNLAVLAQNGRHISLGVMQNKQATLDLRIVMQKRLVLTGSTLRDRSPAEKARLRREIEEKAWGWIASGRIKPILSKIFPLKEAISAHKMMESGAHFGKILLEVGACSA